MRRNLIIISVHESVTNDKYGGYCPLLPPDLHFRIDLALNNSESTETTKKTSK